MKHTLSVVAIVTAMPALAENQRQLEAHEHGVAALNIAIDNTTVAMEFHAPGADIVGFEYEAESDADLAAVNKAVATLSAPLNLFVFPDEANCTVTEARAELESEDDHDEHGHDDHAKHAAEAGHSEFHADYMLTCDKPTALKQIRFAYFEVFPNAQEVEVQIISASGALAFDVERSSPVLDLAN